MKTYQVIFEDSEGLSRKAIPIRAKSKKAALEEVRALYKEQYSKHIVTLTAKS